MTRRAKTIHMLEVAMEVLRQCHPMTVRQVYYQLVSRQVIENKPNAYDAVSRLLVDARRRGEIPWGWVEDRVRQPREVSMWDGLRSFMEDVRLSYRRDVWQDQPRYVEVWLEKDALSAIFEDVLRPYGVTLNVGRGFDGWSSIHGAAERYGERAAYGCETHVLYFGDFDPSGEAMVTSLRERLASCGARPSLVKVGVTFEDIARYDLPVPELPDTSTQTDVRYGMEHPYVDGAW